jgi:transposase
MARTKQPKPLKDRLTKTLLEKLRLRKLTNAEAAEQLGVSESYLSRTVATIQRKEPGKTLAARKAAHALAVQRRQHRERLAKEVKNGVLDVDAAAARAKCSVRTMSRYVAAYVPPRRQRKAA